MSRAIPLSEVVDVLRRVVEPAAWETPDEIRRDARDALDRLTHEHGGGVDVKTACPACGRVEPHTVRP